MFFQNQPTIQYRIIAFSRCDAFFGRNGKTELDQDILSTCIENIDNFIFLNFDGYIIFIKLFG